MSIKAILEKFGSRQLISSAGLLLLYVTGLGALGYGVADPKIMVAVCLFPLVVGTAIALMMDWEAMAYTAIAGALLTLGIGVTRGLGGTMAAVGLGAILVAGAAQLGRWRGPALVAVTGTYLMVSVLWNSGRLTTAIPLSLLVGGAWLLGALAVLKRSTVSSRAMRVWVWTNILLPSTMLLVAHGISSWTLAAVAVFAGLQRIIIERLDASGALPRRALEVFSVIATVSASYLVFGLYGPIVSLAVLGLALQGIGQRRGDESLIAAGLIAALAQVPLLALAHPAFHPTTAMAWHLWSGVSLIAAVLLGLQLYVAPSRVWPGLQAWVLLPLVFLLALAAVSSEVAQGISWPGALTLLWSGAAVGIWILGKRAETLRVPAGILALGALAKLMLWDWPQMGPLARLAMMACMGTTLLITPLLFPPRRVRAPVGADA